MRRRDIDDLDPRVGAQRLHGGKYTSLVFLPEAPARLGSRVGAGDDLDARIAEGRGGDGEGAAQAGYADFQFFHVMYMAC